MNTVSNSTDIPTTGCGVVPNQLLHDPAISVTAKAAYAVVMGMVTEVHSPPDVERIARALGVRERTVEKALGELALHGWGERL